MELAGLALGWTAYCTAHSLLTHPPAERGLRNLLGRRGGLPLPLQPVQPAFARAPGAWHLHLRGPWIVEWEGFWLAVPVTMNLSALVLFALGARAYGPSDFLGLASLRAA